MAKGSSVNPRWKNGRRKKYRARFKAMGLPCHLCGRPIHYDEPSDAQHPLSFVIDEIVPVSRFREGGYSSPEAAADDWNNLAPAHYICNSKRGNKMPCDMAKVRCEKQINLPDGDW